MREKGLQGKMLTIFKHKVKKSDETWRTIEAQYNQVSLIHNIPDVYFNRMKELI
jgi:hypothetical protein